MCRIVKKDLSTEKVEEEFGFQRVLKIESEAAEGAVVGRLFHHRGGVRGPGDEETGRGRQVHTQLIKPPQ